MLSPPTRRVACVWLAGWLAATGHAMIFQATGDPTHNTEAPGGEFANSGWQWQGNWHGFTGTPIATNWFITAKHLSGTVGMEFVLDGARYRTTASFDDPASDLRLWRVCGRFPSHAPLYGGTDEVGRVCVIFGRGVTRGAPVTLTNDAQVELKGWRWGGGSGVLRWGANRVAGFNQYGGERDALLRAAFEADGEPEEAMLSGGDSGGGVFIAREGRWELAGIAYAVDGPFDYGGEGEGFNAALFDRAGLYESCGDACWSLLPLEEAPAPASWYASRISSRRGWIEATMAANPEPETVPILQAAPAVAGPFEPAAAAVVDLVLREIRVPVPPGSTYYQLEACHALRIANFVLDLDRAELVLAYE